VRAQAGKVSEAAEGSRVTLCAAVEEAKRAGTKTQSREMASIHSKEGSHAPMMS